MNRISEIKKGFGRALVFGLAFGILVLQANAQSSSDLTGTYQIDTSRSESVSEIVDSATRNEQVSSSQKEDLEDKLDAPESLTIDVRGNQVTLSSSVTNPVTFTTDGRVQNIGNGNSTMRVRSSIRRGTLKIVSLGGGSDYTISFSPVDNGKGLQVTRMVTTDYLRQTVFADSYYTKTSSNADNRKGNSNDTYSGNKDNGDYSSSDSNDDGYTSSDPNDNGSDKTTRDNRNGKYPRTTTRSGNFYVPNGTVLTGALENHITTKASQNNDKFRMTIESPSEYRGAVVEGFLSGIARRGKGKVTGSSKLTLNFETIRLRNGQTYDFAGVLQSVTDTEGKSVKINEEGQIKGKSRTKESVKRGGIGAGLGAILGGIIGGGKGAIIGATIGGAGGAGTVAVDGQGDLELEQGTQMSIQSTSPNKR